MGSKYLQKIGNKKETIDLYTFSGKNILDFRKWIRYNEFYRHLQRVLTKVDRISMANGVEVGVSLIYQRIIAFAWQLQSDFGFTNQKILKPFLKRSLSGFFPDRAINQSKIFFSPSIEKWLKNELKEEVRDILSGTPSFR